MTLDSGRFGSSQPLLEVVLRTDLANWFRKYLGWSGRSVAAVSILAFGDVAAMLLTGATAQLAWINVAKHSERLGSIGLDIGLVLACGVMSGLYFGGSIDAGERLRLRVHVITRWFGVRLFVLSLSSNTLGLVVPLAMEAGLLLLSSFYIEMMARRALVRLQLRGALLPGPEWPDSIDLTGEPALGAIGDQSSCRRTAHSTTPLPQRMHKRALDFAIAVPVSFFMLPLVGMLALAIKILDPGPAFYRHERVGRHGRTITIIKLRTMYSDAQQRFDQHMTANSEARQEWQRYFKLRNDPRVISGIGAFLRRSSLCHNSGTSSVVTSAWSARDRCRATIWSNSTLSFNLPARVFRPVSPDYGR